MVAGGSNILFYLGGGQKLRLQEVVGHFVNLNKLENFNVWG
jgi:hypothetical protein